ncbi:MAG: hypothetical protein JNM69_32050 [Archangium sp.]|nr:hypothetical protein [Archangium sp.]
MNKFLAYAPYAWLTFSGFGHFLADVVSQRLRGVRVPSLETTLYYGLNTSFALSQVILGALGTWLAWRAPELLREVPLMVVATLAALAWLAITYLFMEYREPKMNAVLVLGLLVASFVAGRPSLPGDE